MKPQDIKKLAELLKRSNIITVMSPTGYVLTIDGSTSEETLRIGALLSQLAKE